MSAKCSPVISALALVLMPVFARGQSINSSAQQLASLDPVVVTASRFEESLSDVPAFAQVISREEMVQSAVTSVPEAVNKLGNIHIRSMLGGPLGILSDIDMRGFGASARDNTLILVDGMRVSPIDSGSIMWESIPINAVERIEIIHGGGSVQFGDKAVGGVINIITRAESSQRSSASMTAGSYGTLLNSGALITAWGNTRAKIDVVANTTDGWRQNSQAQQGVLKGLLSHGLGGQDRVFAEGVYSSQQYHTPGGVVGEVNTGDRRAAKFNNVNEKTTSNGSRGLIGLAKSFGDGWQFLTEVAYSDSASNQVRPYYANDGDATSAGQIAYDKSAYDLTPRLKKVWDSRHDSVFGLDYQRATASYRPDTGDRENATIENKSFYATHRFLLSPAVEISGGARRQLQDAEAYDKKDAIITTATKHQSVNASDLSAVYRFGETLVDKIFFRSNRSYRFANTDEYWKSVYQSVAPYALIGRSFAGILRPQRANTMELGGSLSATSKTSISGTLFQIDTTDEIRYSDATSENINAPNIRRQGATLHLRHQLSRALRLQSNLTWQHAEYREGAYVGKEVPLVPRVIAGLGLTYEANQRLFYRMNVNYSGTQRYMDDDDNSKNLMPAYTVVDLGARYQSTSWEFDFQVRNAIDQKYATYGGYGFITKLPTSGYSYYYYPGDPRSFWLSARYKFN